MNISLTNEELVWMYQAGNEEAIMEVINRNQGAIRTAVKKAMESGANSVAFDADDMYQTALMALLDCARRYNHRMQVKFMTFAWGNMRSIIMNESFENKYTIHIPRNILNDMRKYAKLKDNVSEDAVVSDFMEITEKEIENYERYEAQYANAVSLNVDVTDDGKEGIDTIADTHREEAIENNRRLMVIEDAMDRCNLSQQDREILANTFGLYGEGCSVEQLAKRQGCSRQWINIRKNKALKKLREVLESDGMTLADCLN